MTATPAPAPVVGLAEAIAGRDVQGESGRSDTGRMPVPQDTGATPLPPAGAGSDATQLIVNDPLVKRAVELFNARIVHVEPWSKP